MMTKQEALASIQEKWQWVRQSLKKTLDYPERFQRALQRNTGLFYDQAHEEGWTVLNTAVRKVVLIHEEWGTWTFIRDASPVEGDARDRYFSTALGKEVDASTGAISV